MKWKAIADFGFSLLLLEILLPIAFIIVILISERIR